MNLVIPGAALSVFGIAVMLEFAVMAFRGVIDLLSGGYNDMPRWAEAILSRWRNIL